MNVPGPVPRLDHAHGRQRAQPRPHAGTTDAHTEGQLTLSRQTVSGAQFAPFDEVTDVTDDELGGNPLERFLGGLLILYGHTSSPDDTCCFFASDPTTRGPRCQLLRRAKNASPAGGPENTHVLSR